MDWSNAIAFGGCTSVCIFARCTIPASTFGQTASDWVWSRWATNGTSLGVTKSGIWQCEQAELKKWAYDWFSRRALASPIFPTAPFQKPLSRFLRRLFSVPHHDLSCFRPPLPPSSSSLNVFPPDNSPTPTSAAATRTFRGREAAR